MPGINDSLKFSITLCFIKNSAEKLYIELSLTISHFWCTSSFNTEGVCVDIL